MTGGESPLGGRSPAAAGTCRLAASSRASCPASRRPSTAAAVKLLVMDAMRKSVRSSGGPAPSPGSPMPPRVTRRPSTITPYAMAGM